MLCIRADHLPEVFWFCSPRALLAAASTCRKLSMSCQEHVHLRFAPHRVHLLNSEDFAVLGSIALGTKNSSTSPEARGVFKGVAASMWNQLHEPWESLACRLLFESHIQEVHRTLGMLIREATGAIVPPARRADSFGLHFGVWDIQLTDKFLVIRESMCGGMCCVCRDSNGWTYWYSPITSVDDSRKAAENIMHGFRYFNAANTESPMEIKDDVDYLEDYAHIMHIQARRKWDNFVMGHEIDHMIWQEDLGDEDTFWHLVCVHDHIFVAMISGESQELLTGESGKLELLFEFRKNSSIAHVAESSVKAASHMVAADSLELMASDYWRYTVEEARNALATGYWQYTINGEHRLLEHWSLLLSED